MFICEIWLFVWYLPRILKPKQYARQSNEVKHKKQQSTQCRACDTIYISKYVNSFLSTNPTFFFFFFFLGGGGGGVRREGCGVEEGVNSVGK